MKKALVISYSQAGQTQRAVETFVSGLKKNMECDHVLIQSQEEFKFPWKMSEFFRAFPRCVGGLAPKTNALNVHWEDYDLIVLGYQVWFLSPSLPIQGFLQSADTKALKGKKVLTLLTCRNLWYSASETISKTLKNLGAEHLGQITLCETSPLWASFVTTPRWMLTGKKSAFAFFPPAGIDEKEFTELHETAQKIGISWNKSQQIAPELMKSNLNRLSLYLMNIVGIRFFRIWTKLILSIAPKKGIAQDVLLLFFRANLILLILVITPCTKIVELLAGNSRLSPATR